MTHSLHRRGSRESLEKDFVVLSCSAKGFNDKVFGEKGKEFLRICLRHNPVNFGDMKTGNFLYIDPEEIIARVSNTTILEVTYDDKQDVVELIRELKEADLGVSVVISGLHDVVEDIVWQAGLKRIHTREFSLGSHGRLELLPEYEILEFTTMCGHAMVASGLVKHMIAECKLGRRSLRDAAVVMGRCCSCGNFNVNRAQDLLARNLGLWVADWPVY